MDVEFVRAAAHYAGWDVLEKKDGFFYCGFGDWHLDVNCDLFKSVMYPLLLQRAIEGVNSEMVFSIIQYPTKIRVLNMKTDAEENFQFDIKTKYKDQAKEQALRYIYEQEMA